MFLCESGTYQCRESQPGRGNQFPVLQNSWLTELVHVHVVVGMEAAGRSFGGACGWSCIGRRAYRLRVAGEVAGHFSREAGRRGRMHPPHRVVRGVGGQGYRSPREEVAATITS